MGPQSAVDREFTYIYIHISLGGAAGLLSSLLSSLFSLVFSLFSSLLSFLFSLLSSLFSLFSLLFSKKRPQTQKNGFSCRRHAIFFCLWLLVCTRRNKNTNRRPMDSMIFFLCFKPSFFSSETHLRR